MANKALILLSILFICSCSQQKMYQMVSKKPKLKYEKPLDYDALNDYQKDALYLSALIQQSYPRLDSKISPEDFAGKSERLLSDLEQVTSDLDFQALLKRYIAALKDGHTYIPSFNYSVTEETKYFNWAFFKEKENWVISRIDKSLDTALIGARILSINGIPIKQIEERARNFENGENYFHTNALFKRKVFYPRYWKAMGVIENEEQISFTVDNHGRTERHELQASPKYSTFRKQRQERHYPFTAKQNQGYSYQIDSLQDYAYLQMNTSLDYVSFKSEVRNYTSILVRPFAKLFFKKAKKDAMDFGKVLQQLFSEIDATGINNLIIDLRYNSGGDERTGKQLLWYLTERKDIKGFTEILQVSEYFRKTAKKDYKKYNELYEAKYDRAIPMGEINLTKEFNDQPYFYDITQPDSPFLLDSSISKFKGKVCVIVGPGTFSAAQYLATTLADNGLATIVGTPTGNMPSCQTGASALKLPLTKTLLQISYTYGERPDTSKNHEVALFPDIERYQSFAEYLAGRDVQFEAVLEEIGNRNSMK